MTESNGRKVLSERKLNAIRRVLNVDAHHDASGGGADFTARLYGRYLTEALAHCAECHSGRDLFGGIRAGQRYAGGPDPEGRGWVPNITAKGLGSWSKSDVSELLGSGFTPDFDSVGSSMADVVKNMAALPKADRDAMAEYLKSLPAVDGPPKPAKK